MDAFDVLEGLLIIEQNDYDLGSFFLDKKIESIILYGIGRVGIRAYATLKNTGVHIEYICDKDADNIDFAEKKLISPYELSNNEIKADAIVVTPTALFEDIRTELKKYTDIEAISLEDIVLDCLKSINYPKVRRIPQKPQDNKRNVIDRVGRSRSVLIFGGGSGIGKAIAEKMLGDGAKVTIAGRNIKKLILAKEEIKSGNLYIAKMDISSVDEHRNYFFEASKIMGGLDAVVNSTLYHFDDQNRGFEPWDVTEEEWDNQSDTDFKGAFFFIRNAVDYFLENNVAGNILSISSIAGYEDIIGCYGASKLAVSRWTKAFGKKYGHDGIVINAIAPGATFTDAISDYAKSIDQEFPHHAINRFIRAEEIADLAKMCLGDKSVILCGSTIVADGGASTSFL